MANQIISKCACLFISDEKHKMFLNIEHIISSRAESQNAVDKLVVLDGEVVGGHRVQVGVAKDLSR